MKLLLVTWYFPPSRTIAAVRLGNLARYLMKQGHDLRILTPQNPPLPQDLAIDIPEECVVRTPWRTANATSDHTTQLKVPLAGEVEEATHDEAGWLKRKYWQISESFSQFPDARAPWLNFALQAGSELLESWRPDLLYSSGPPFTTLLIGQELAKSFNLPLIVEFRDRWCDDPYSPPLFWRRRREKLAERALIDQAAALITVSEPWAKTYRERYGKSTKVIYNGYDAELCREGPFEGAPGSDVLEIVYTGGIYPGYRDPSPLFAAMKHLDQRGLTCRMTFHGVRPAVIAPLAKARGVSHLVEIGEVLTHDATISRQRESDVLVLLQWNNPKEQGNVPGKFFEYLGARRPILVLGLHEGVPATILRERNAGICLNEPGEIADQLQCWLKIKQDKGLLPAVPESARAGFGRDEQFARLESFLMDMIEKMPRP